MDNDRITNREAARLLHYSTDGLYELRKRGVGPPPLPNHSRRVYYSRAEVLAWLDSDEYRAMARHGK